MQKFINHLSSYFKSKTPHLKSGQNAERLAKKYLEGQGLKLISKNYRSQRGEIDLIMSDGLFVIFVEVKFRHSGQWMTIYRTVTLAKQKRIIATAKRFLCQHDDYREMSYRFDVVLIRNGTKPKWIKNAFQVPYPIVTH